jgi:hypothetical protein
MTVEEFITKLNENELYEIKDYEILLRELKSDFKYEYTNIEFEKIDHELKTIIIKKEL